MSFNVAYLQNTLFGKRYNWKLVSNFIKNNTAKIQLKILGRTFRLTSVAIVIAKKVTLCWVLSHDAKEREAETEPGKVLVGHVFNGCNGKDVESKLGSGLSC